MAATSWDARLLPRPHAGGPFFSGGFGPQALLEQLSGRTQAFGIPELGIVRQEPLRERGGHAGFSCAVESPAAVGPLPAAARTLRFTLRTPRTRTSAPPPMAILVETVPLLGALPGRLLATALAAAGVGSIQLLAPWHGVRTPPGASSGVPRTVSDFLLMQRATALEAAALAAWLLAQGHPRVALTGHGLGGALAAHAAALFPLPLALAPLLAPESAAAPFLTGGLADEVDLAALERESAGAPEARERLTRALGSVAVPAQVPGTLPRAVLLAARADRWIPPSSTLRLSRALPGATVRFVPGGHAHAALRTGAAVDAVLAALSRVGPLAAHG